MVRKREKIPENLEIVEFPKSDIFNRKLRKFLDENEMEWKFPGQNRKSKYTSGGCPLFRKLCKFAMFLFVLELHIPCKDQYFTLESCHLSDDKYQLR